MLVLALTIIICCVSLNIAFRWSGSGKTVLAGRASNADEAKANEKFFPVTINRPVEKLGILSGVNSNGEEFKVACSTCHAGRQPNFANRISADLKEFHNQHAVIHGGISCLSCHNPDDYDSFRMADGTKVAYTDVMQLCAQCHGPQKRDYDNGVHGGMNGHWDRTRGPQQKLNCVDCHFAHQPKFPQMQPDFKPRDRFLKPSHHIHIEAGQH